jgi:hypothetical protein
MFVQKIFLDYTYGIGKIYTAEAKQSPSFELLAMFGGVGIGLLGLTWYESRYMKKKPVQSNARFREEESGVVTAPSSSGHNHESQQQHLLQEVNAYKLAMMIAIGIGAHALFLSDN